MAMQVNGNYEHSRTDYAERVKEKQTVWRAEKANEAEKAAEEKKAYGTVPGRPGRERQPKNLF